MQKPANYPSSPEYIWNRFFDITQIPHPSKKEEQIRNYLVGVAKDNNLKNKVDSVGNVIIYVPATVGKENNEVIIIQNHMDMVTDATPDRKIDFAKDPIKTFVEGGWLKADRTTLGADNGIGCAAALALIDDKSVEHPPLELVFTVDEETGLNGANGLDVSLISGRKLINLDTEDWGSIFVGCAGGIDYQYKGTFNQVKASKTKIPIQITIGNLRGGHSGCDIHLQLANSIKLLGEVLFEIKDCAVELVSIKSGRAHNIIPRDAISILYVEKDDISKIEKNLKDLSARWKSYISAYDQDVTVSLEKLENCSQNVISSDDFKKVINLITVFPHGAHSYNFKIDDLVSMSNNLAIFNMLDGNLYVETSVRFLDRGEAVPLENVLKSLSDLYSLEVRKVSEYPSWKPDFNSSLLELAKEEYLKIYGVLPQVKAIHAGLECGIINDKLGGSEAISMGPNIRGAHSPSERMEIDSVEKFWNYLKALLAAL